MSVRQSDCGERVVTVATVLQVPGTPVATCMVSATSINSSVFGRISMYRADAKTREHLSAKM